MLYRTMFSRDLFAEMDRLHQDLAQALDWSPSIRGIGRGYPALNVGGTVHSVEIYAFAPGLDPASIEAQIDKGVLTLSGERKAEPLPEKATRHIDERHSGRFRRVVSLPDDIDPNAVTARYRDGVLHLSIRRRDSAQPRRIDIH